MKASSAPTSETLATTKTFWGVGVAVMIFVVTVLVAEFVIWSSKVSEAGHTVSSAMRKSYPRFVWALDEWERCNLGVGDYTTYGYVTKEQCDMALSELGKVRGQQVEVMAMLTEQRERIDAAGRSVKVLWPLSMIFFDHKIK